MKKSRRKTPKPSVVTAPRLKSWQKTRRHTLNVEKTLSVIQGRADASEVELGGLANALSHKDPVRALQRLTEGQRCVDVGLGMLAAILHAGYDSTTIEEWRRLQRNRRMFDELANAILVVAGVPTPMDVSLEGKREKI